MTVVRRAMVGCLLAALLVAAPAAVALAQDSVAAAKEAYGAAAYQDALAMLDRLKTAHPAPDAAIEIDKYRAFCLFALGRNGEAELAVGDLVSAQPHFRLADGEASPRVMAAFQEARRKRLPDLIEQAYKRGREAYDQKRTDDAIAEFRLAIDLMQDPDAPGDQVTRDMRTVAEGFMGLLEATRAAEDAARKAAEQKAAESKRAAQPPAPPPKPYYTVEDKDVVPPEAIRQDIPSWPANVQPISATGVLDVLINEKGEVESAALRSHLHPLFDALLVERAKTWRYRPATRDGKPVKYLKLIGINVQPPATREP